MQHSIAPFTFIQVMSSVLTLSARRKPDCLCKEAVLTSLPSCQILEWALGLAVWWLQLKSGWLRSPVRGPVGRGRGNAMPAWMTA
eukprot:4830692-Amphidinium_carterae.1